MHLTNYSVNKKNEDFVENDGRSDTASKRPLSFVRLWLRENGFDEEAIWGDIKRLVRLTIISALPTLRQTYRVRGGGDLLTR